MSKNSIKLNKDERYSCSTEILLIQITLFIIPLIALVYIYRVEQYTFLIPYLYTTSTAGFILNLGNGRISINLNECKYIIDLSNIKFKKYVYMTSSSDTRLSKIDYYYQIFGYMLLIVGVLFSTVLTILAKRQNMHEFWNELDSTFSKFLFGYVIVIATFGLLIRFSVYVYENYWYKKSVKNN